MTEATYSPSHDQLRRLPLGPKLRAYLAISDADYLGALAAAEVLAPGSAEAEALTAYLRGWHQQAAATLPAPAVVDLLDELVAMALPEAALDLAAARPDATRDSDFRAQLALGVAAMLSGDHAKAAQSLRAAQAAMPSEPAPYVNLTQILLRDGALDDAEIWCLAGLDAELNNFALWDLMAEIMHARHGDLMPELLMALASKRGSWAGLSLAANLTATGDRYLKANLLEHLYGQGERDHTFLIELTGAYGVASDFAKIPPLVWQAEQGATGALPWQLYVHAAQAQLALGEPGAALAQLSKARQQTTLPDGVPEALAELVAEAEAAMSMTMSVPTPVPAAGTVAGDAGTLGAH